jgi:hypothetical protein
VLGPKFDNTIEISAPRIDLLAGKTGDEIQVDVRETLATQHCKVGQHSIGFVQTPCAHEVLVLKRLRAETDSRNTQTPILPNLALRQSSEGTLRTAWRIRPSKSASTSDGVPPPK